ncbi:DUF1389 domain-containing protein [Chlamydia vaughanii]|uniref:DUF1389 domain-containing protein n=1 Tax=Chlamydia vaughanii TaxID=3112552 RepID=UPI0032B1A02F
MSLTTSGVPLTTAHPGGVSKKLASGLRNHALAITGIVFSIISVACIAAVVLGVTHPAILLGLALSVVVATVMLALAARRYLQPAMPQGFLDVIRETYPRVIYDLCVEKRLTIQELRFVLACLSAGDFSFLSKNLEKKVKSFGIGKLESACQGMNLPVLDNVLLKHCPWHLMKRFIDEGPKSVPESYKMLPQTYWTAPLGLTVNKMTAFDKLSWFLAQTLTEGEYAELCRHAQGDTWEEAKDLVDSVQERMLAKLNDLDDALINKRHAGKDLCRKQDLLVLCKHGISWEQLQLFKQVSVYDLNELGLLENFGVGTSTWRSFQVVHPYIHETSGSYDHDIDLLTWSELLDGVKAERAKGVLDWHLGLVNFLNRRVRNKAVDLKSIILKGPASLLGIPVFNIDVRTGERKEFPE